MSIEPGRCPVPQQLAGSFHDRLEAPDDIRRPFAKSRDAVERPLDIVWVLDLLQQRGEQLDEVGDDINCPRNARTGLPPRLGCMALLSPDPRRSIDDSSWAHG